jgi:hypothetical protein
MKLRRNIATSESGFVFNPTNGDSFSTNPVGTEILFLLKEGMSFKEIKETLVSRYDSEPSVIEKDIDDFSLALKGFNLLEHES